MEETKNFELPSPFEKLSTKFIMEAFRQQRDADAEPPVGEVVQEICGTEAQADSGTQELAGEPPPIT